MRVMSCVLPQPTGPVNKIPLLSSRPRRVASPLMPEEVYQQFIYHFVVFGIDFELGAELFFAALFEEVETPVEIERKCLF